MVNFYCFLIRKKREDESFFNELLIFYGHVNCLDCWRTVVSPVVDPQKRHLGHMKQQRKQLLQQQQLNHFPCLKMAKEHNLSYFGEKRTKNNYLKKNR